MALVSDAHQFAPCFDKAQGLFDGGFGVHGVGIGHGLDSNGGSSAKGEVAYCYLSAHGGLISEFSDYSDYSELSDYFFDLKYTSVAPAP